LSKSHVSYKKYVGKYLGHNNPNNQIKLWRKRGCYNDKINYKERPTHKNIRR